MIELERALAEWKRRGLVVGAVIVNANEARGIDLGVTIHGDPWCPRGYFRILTPSEAKSLDEPMDVKPLYEALKQGEMADAKLRQLVADLEEEIEPITDRSNSIDLWWRETIRAALRKVGPPWYNGHEEKL